MVGCSARSAGDSLLREGGRSHDRSQSRSDKACQRDREKRDDYDDDNNGAITLVIWKITPAGPPAGVFFFWRANAPGLQAADLLQRRTLNLRNRAEIFGATSTRSRQWRREFGIVGASQVRVGFFPKRLSDVAGRRDGATFP